MGDSRFRANIACRSVIGSVALVAVGLLGVSPASAALPDGRVFEQVSPPDKRGADVLPNRTRLRASVDGDRVFFSSLTAFGDAHGIGTASEYLAVRDGDGSGGWSTHGVSPRQDSTGYFGGVFGGLEPYYRVLSGDLSRGVFLSRPPLTDAPNVATAANLYRRTDMLSPGLGSYELLTDSLTAQPPSRAEAIDPSFGFWEPQVGDVTADLSQVLFESPRNLTADTTACTELAPDTSCPVLLYEYADGGQRLVGYVPASPGATSCTGTEPDCIPSPTSQAGRGTKTNNAVTERTLSRDGSRALFTVRTSTTPRAGALYMRDDQATPSTADDTTIQINVSEKTAPDDVEPATLWTASTGTDQNGDRVPLRVFFTTDEQLTDDDIDDGGDAYMWSEQADGSGNHLTRLSIDNEPADFLAANVIGVIGASEDGSYVYFATANNQLIAGGPTDVDTTARIYVWREGSLREASGSQTGIEMDDMLNVSGAYRDTSRVSPDGKYLAFITEGSGGESLSLYGRPEPDHDGDCPGLDPLKCSEVYVYDATANGGAGDLHCASCDPTGAGPTGDTSFDPGSQEGLGATGDSVYQNHALSDDGRFVFFNTRERLQPGDRDDAMDAYEYDTTTRQVHLISEGDGTANSAFMDASPDGHDVFFTTRDRLRSSDTDQGRDLYVARVGGTPDPGVSVETPCSGDGCQGASSDKPGGVSPLSTRTYDLGGRTVPRNCFTLTRRASRLSRQAQRLRRSARRASDSRAVRLRRRAGRLDRQVRRLKVNARSCNRAARKAGR